MKGAHAAFRAVRRAVRQLAREGHAWHAAIDGVRPHVQAIWNAWPPSERASGPTKSDWRKRASWHPTMA